MTTLPISESGLHALTAAKRIKHVMDLIHQSGADAMQEKALALACLDMAQHQYEPEPRMAWLRKAEAQIAGIRKMNEQWRVIVDATFAHLVDPDGAHVASSPTQEQSTRLERIAKILNMHDELVTSLDEAIAGYAASAAYKGDYLREKHGDAATIAHLDAILAKARGDAS